MNPTVDRPFRAGTRRGASAWLRRGAGMAGVAAALLLGLPARAEEAAAPPVAVTQQVGPNSHVFVDAEPGALPANAGFVVTATSVVVIGVPDSAAAAARWLDAIRTLTPKPVSHLLLTGYQPEQADGVAALKANGAAIVARRVAAPRAEAAASAPELAALPPEDAASAPDDAVPSVEPAASAPEALAPGAPASAEPAERARPAVPAGGAPARQLVADLWLEDSTDLLFGGVHLQALALGPVHGPHDMAYLVPDDGVMYAGGLLVTGRLPDVRDADAARWVEALAELEKQGATVAVPAYGAASREPGVDLQRLRDYLGALRDAMGEAARTRTPFDDAYDLGDWSRWAGWPMFEALNRANARHTYLQAQGPAD